MNFKAAIRAITNIPGWSMGIDRAGKITSASAAYDRIPAIRRAVDLIADSVVSVPHYIHRDKDDVDWPFAAELDDLIRDTVRAYLIEGAGYWLKQQNRVRVMDVQWLNPTTMTVVYDGRRTDGSLGLIFTQSSQETTQSWNETQILYFRQFGLSDDILPGRSRVSVVLEAAAVRAYIVRFDKTFFESGAMPTLVTMADGNPSDAEVKRAETFFRRTMTGFSNAFRVLGLKGKWTFQNVTPDMNTLAMPEVAAIALEEVAIGMGIPLTMLTDAANFATAQQHNAEFWSNTIVPLCRLLEGVINRGLLKAMGLNMTFAEEELDVFQEDETQRALSLTNLRTAGLPLVIAMQILGYELPEGLTYDDLEQVIEDRQQQMQESLAGNSQPANNQPLANDGQQSNDAQSSSSARADLQAWERYAVKRLKRGTALREFESDGIAPTLKAAIQGALEAVRTPDQAHSIFSDALSWEAYP